MHGRLDRSFIGTGGLSLVPSQRNSAIEPQDNPPPSVHTRQPPPQGGGIDTDAIKEWLWAFVQQSLDYAVLLVDTGGCVVWANPGATWILAATTQEIVGGPVSRFFTPEDIAFGIPEHEINSAARQGSSDDDRWMLRADGSRYWSAGRTVALRDREGALQGYLKIFRDQTELKMRIAALRNRALLVDADQRARMRMLAAMTRELQALLGASSHEDSNGVALRIAEDIAQVVHAGDQTLELQLEPLRLDEEIAAVVELASRRAGHTPAIDVLLPPGRPIVLEGDRRRIRQALVELLENAIRTTRADGSIWINASVENAQALVRIEDNGAGMDAETQARVYALLTDPNAPADPRGLGSGLSLARFLLELHGGTIQARSPGPGKGSEFSVRLPLSQSGREVPTPL